LPSRRRRRVSSGEGSSTSRSCASEPAVPRSAPHIAHSCTPPGRRSPQLGQRLATSPRPFRLNRRISTHFRVGDTGRVQRRAASIHRPWSRPSIPSRASPHAAACSPPFERREDPRRDGGRAPAVDEVEQVMEVDVAVCCERVRQRRIAAGLTQDITAPSQDVSWDIARCRLPSDVGFHVSSRGCRVVWCSRLSWRAFRAASYVPERDEPPEVRTRAPATQTK
jgi:hypothetical protein